MTNRSLFKIGFLILALIVITGFLVIMTVLGPIIVDAFRSGIQRRALQNRSDYPQIAAACATLARSFTNESTLVPITDPRVPSLLTSLSPRYIAAGSNSVTLEFHGGFDHYGYKVRQSETDSRQWTIAYYTEQGEKVLTTITGN